MALFDSCQGKWKLGFGTYTDQSGNGNTLTVTTGTPSATTGFDGTANAAADFIRSQTDGLTIADGSQTGLDITGDMSIHARVNFDATNDSNFYMIVSKWENAGQKSYDFHLNDAGKLKCRISSDGTAISASCIGGTVLSPSTDYEVSVVYNGTDVRIYLDNVLDSNGASNPVTYSSGIFSGTDDFFVGTEGTDAHEMDGKIQDVAIWNKALSATERGVLSGQTDSFGVRGVISGTIKDSDGTAVNLTTYDTWLAVYPVGNTATAPIASSTPTASDGTFEIVGALVPHTMYKVVAHFEGSYAPKSETDIVGAGIFRARRYGG